MTGLGLDAPPPLDENPSKGCLIGGLLCAVLWGVLAALGAMVL